MSTSICQDYLHYFIITDESVKEIPLHIPVPRNLNDVFGDIRKKFAKAFSNIRDAINKRPPPLDRLKLYLEDGYSQLRSQISHSNSIDEILDVVRDHCTLINISCLEGIVEHFDIKEAETHITEYKAVVQSFCKETKVSLCLGKSFKATKHSSLLRCETAIFVLDRDPKDYTLEDIKDILSKSLKRDVDIRYIQRGKSVIIITCFFPLSQLGPLITISQETLESVKKKGLFQLIVGNCIIYDYKRDKVRDK